MLKINSDNIIKHITKLYDEEKYNDVIDYILMFDEICFIKKDSICDKYILNIVAHNHYIQIITMHYITPIKTSHPIMVFNRSYEEFIRREMFNSSKLFDIHFNKLKLTTKINML